MPLALLKVIPRTACSEMEIGLRNLDFIYFEFEGTPFILNKEI